MLSTEQVWAIHNTMTEADYRNAVLVMAFAGLRIGKAVALRWSDVGDDVISVRRQHDGAELKTNKSSADAPVAPAMLAMLTPNSSEYVTGAATHRDVRTAFATAAAELAYSPLVLKAV